MLTEKTLQSIHRTYNSIAEDSVSTNLIDILLELQRRLLELDVPKQDSEDFDSLLRNIERSIETRKKTFRITTFVCYIVLTLLYIVIWANRCKNLCLDINFTARRKSLESELTKSLFKSLIHDMFGIRGILLNKDSEDDRIESKKLLTFSKLVEEIFTQSRLNKKNTFYEFYNWIQSNNEIDPIDKQIVEYILRIPFKLISKKDYVSNPKKNLYKSIHVILAVEMFSEIHPGVEVELQFRTNRMHQNAENGNASHDKYKEESIDDKIKNVFTIDNVEKANIVGLTSYKSSDDDLDGVHTAKIICNRRASSSLINF